MENVQHIFIVGCKGIPCSYGGYETFVDKLTEYHQDNDHFKYHVACKSNEDGEFEYHNAHCFKVKVPDIGGASAILYDVKAIKKCIRYIKENKIQHPIVYCLACRIGPFARKFQKQIHRLGGVFYVNPDGHEWLRSKWPLPVRKYWKISESMMIKHADLLICDSKNIETYIHSTYSRFKPKTTFSAYGAEVQRSKLADDDDKFLTWLHGNLLKPKEYYLIVGRFVPENNYETMIREFLACHTKKSLAIITNVNNKFLKELENKLHFVNDARIKFVGTVYDQELLKKIRENAYGYLHGHEVGGTNPSLLEALASTDLNLLFDVGFNREVAENSAVYWNKEQGNLARVIECCDRLKNEEIEALNKKAKKRIECAYTWHHIAANYMEVWDDDERR